MTNSSAPPLSGKLLALHVTCPGVDNTEHFIECGASLIIGNGGNCGLRLEGDEISPIHCVVRYSEGKVAIQDWCSKSGTFVDGTRIADEVSVDPGVELRVGDYRLQTTLTDSVPSRNSRVTETPDKEDRLVSHEVDAQAETPAPKELTTEDIDALLQLGRDEAAREEKTTDRSANHKLTPKPEAEPELDPEVLLLEADEASKPAPPEDRVAAERPAAKPSTPQRRPSRKNIDQSFNQETIELLQEEIELLQSELTERDARIMELTAQLNADVTSEVDPAIDSSETEALVGRLEQLLDELERSDQRVRTLEELLRTAQESSQADSEEREQVERWLGDIEKRVAEREAEWQAERVVLTKRIEELRSELDESDRHISQGTSGSNEAHHAALQKLRDENERLREELEEGRDMQRRLQSRLAEIGSKSAAEVQNEQVEEAIREERLKLAQQRAALSRERAELARRAADTQQPSSRAAAVDDRFHAFRQTLRELHEQEEKPTNKPTLASRISDLWRRLDGPTDSD